MEALHNHKWYATTLFHYFLNFLSGLSFLHLQKKILKKISDHFHELLQDDLLVATSVFNPRQKLRAFQPTVAPGLKKPSAAEASATVKRLLNSIQYASYTVSESVSPACVNYVYTLHSIWHFATLETIFDELK